MAEYKDLEDLIETLNDLRDENLNNRCMDFSKLRKTKENFFNFFKDLADRTYRYGWSVEYKIFIKDGSSEFSPFIVRFTPFEKNDDLMLIGFWEDKNEKFRFFYSLNPDASDYESKGVLGIPCLDFVYLQVLEKEEEIKEMIIKQFKEDLQKRITLEKELDTLYKTYV